MRHIHNYKSFNETFTTNPTDISSVNAAKQYYNKLELDIKEYRDNKDKLKQLYTDVVTDKDKNVVLLNDDTTLKTKVDALIGKTDIKPGKDRSPLISKYFKQLDIERQIIKKEKTQSADKNALDVLTKSQESSGSKEIDPRIKETEEKMSINNSDILSLRNELIKQEKEFNDFITKETNELKKSIKTISDLSNKIQIGNVVSLKK
jgi:hypothetical protein